MDYTKPIEIAPDIFWVGYVIPDDPFQCHVYLIKNGKESILIDPGSMITFPVVLEKITSVLPLRDIKYIIMHHQDPDIVSCYTTLEKLFPEGNRYIVTHWRTEMLLKHYEWKTPFYLIDKNEWKLKAGDREIEFIFTPYMHFAGAFCTYDKKSKILFSSDIFGGLTPKFELFAKNVDEYFEYAKNFHTHYIPNKQILSYTMNKFLKKDISMIAPQHGSIIKKEFIKPLIEKMNNLECGIYLMDDYYDDIFLLNRVEDTLNSILKQSFISNSFENIIKILYMYLKEEIPEIEHLIFVTKNNYFKVSNAIQIQLNNLIENNYEECNYSCQFKLGIDDESKLIVCCKKALTKKDLEFLKLLLKKFTNILGITIKKDIMISNLKKREKELYKKAVSDSLTNLYNRDFFEDILEKNFLESQRYDFPLSLAIIDIDFFKKINDTYGHLKGDCVLKKLATLLKNNFRKNEIIVRYGGEEFVIVMPFTNLKNACKKMENIKNIIKNYNFCDENLKITVSGGVTEYNKKDNISEFLKKADKNLYEAKEKGRNKIICK